MKYPGNRTDSIDKARGDWASLIGGLWSLNTWAPSFFLVKTGGEPSM